MDPPTWSPLRGLSYVPSTFRIPMWTLRGHPVRGPSLCGPRYVEPLTWTLLRVPYLGGPSTLLMGPPYVKPPFLGPLQCVFESGPGPYLGGLLSWTSLYMDPPCVDPPYVEPLTWTHLPVPYLAPYVGLPYIGPRPYVDPPCIHPHKDNQREQICKTF